MKISVICVYNNKNILEKCLLKTLAEQKKDFELILIDNTKNKFKCAADALNYGGKNAKGDLLLFIHQDVKLFKNNINDILNYCKELKNFGIAGIAGTDLDNGYMKSCGLHNIPPEPMTFKKINKIEKAQTLDEVALIIPNNIFNLYKFNNTLCNDWHLYGVEYCLNLIKNGYSVYVLPIELYHVSNTESINIEYFNTLKRIFNYYKNDFDIIHTNCWGSCNPKNQAKLNFLILTYKLHLKEHISKLLKKIKKFMN